MRRVVWNARTRSLNEETVSDRQQWNRTFIYRTTSSAEWEISTTSVSMGKEGRGSSAAYKGNDHEDGNGARTVHGPISISLAWSLGTSSRHLYCRRVDSLELSGPTESRAALQVSPDAVSGWIARPCAYNSLWNTVNEHRNVSQDPSRLSSERRDADRLPSIAQSRRVVLPAMSRVQHPVSAHHPGVSPKRGKSKSQLSLVRCQQH